MAITTSAPNGVVVTSAAMNETLGSQAQGNGSDEVVVSDDIVTLSNGNLAGSPFNVYTGRLAMIRQGQSDQEVKKIIGETAGTGTTLILTVHEPWDTPPASSDTIHVSYIIQDAATVTGLGLINKRNDDYSSSRRFSVGNGTAVAFFAMLDGVSLETVDNSSTTVADVIVLNNGYFFSGYLAGGVPVGGAAIFGTPALNGELVMDFQSGSYVRLYNFYLKCVANNKIIYAGDVVIKNAIMFGCMWGTTALGAVLAENVSWGGRGNSNETIQVDQTTDIQSMVLADTHGFDSPDDAATESIHLHNITFIGQGRKLWVHNDKTWRMINPSWTVEEGTQADIEFENNSNNAVYWEQHLAPTVQTPAGVAIDDAAIFIYEGLRTESIVQGGTSNEIRSDSNGEALAHWVYKQYNDNAGTSLTVLTDGSHFLKIFKHGYSPFVGAIVSNEDFESPVALTVDGFISELNPTTALSNGSGISVDQPTFSIQSIPYDDDPDPGNNVAFADGETVTFSGGGTGTIKRATSSQIPFNGDAISGRYIVERTNATTIGDNETMTGGTSGVAYVNAPGASDIQNFSIHIDCNAKSLQTVYDYLSALLEENPVSTEALLILEWGEGEWGYILFQGGSGFFTEYNVTQGEGVILTNRGAGSVDSFTDDDGNILVPPTTVTHTLTGMQQNTEVTYVRLSDGEIVFHVEDVDGTGQSDYSYVYTGDVTVNILIYHVSYDPIYLDGIVLGGSNTSIPVSQRFSRFYSNP